LRDLQDHAMIHVVSCNKDDDDVHISSVLRPLTHFPETGSRNLRHKFNAWFRRLKAANDVISRASARKMAPESGVKFMAQVSGAGF